MQDFILSPLPLKELETLIFKQVSKALKEFHPANNNPAKDELLTIKEAADLLSISTSTLYKYVHRREIPCKKRRGRLYFSKFELTEWVNSGTRSTIAEIEANALNSLVR
ncbi:MAG: helix-turn-helix domain-containing protein [Mariniphaga sp.]|jgi:excisionase family DNA binding protein